MICVPWIFALRPSSQTTMGDNPKIAPIFGAGSVNLVRAKGPPAAPELAGPRSCRDSSVNPVTDPVTLKIGPFSDHPTRLLHEKQPRLFQLRRNDQWGEVAGVDQANRHLALFVPRPGNGSEPDRDDKPGPGDPNDRQQQRHDF